MEVGKKFDELLEKFETFKKANDEKLEQLRKDGVADPLLVKQVEEANAAVQKASDEHKALIKASQEQAERIEELERRLDRPVRDGERDGYTQEQKEHLQAFECWIRDPKSRSAESALIEAQARAQAQRHVKVTINEDGKLVEKAVTVGTPAAGGYAVPEIIERSILSRVLDLSPMRQDALVRTVGSTDYKELINLRGAAGGWVGEGDARTETDTSQFREVAPTWGICYAYPKASEESLDDIFFNVEQWLVQESSDILAQQEGDAFVAGDGTKKPTGLLAGVPVSTKDTASPARAAGVLQYIPTGAAGAFPNSRVDSPPGDPGDPLLDCVYALQKSYRMNARWRMNKLTLATVRKFKDADGNYLWAPGLQAGQPDRLLGYPVSEDESMPDIGSNTFPIAFGDFMRGYLITDLASFGLRITRDDNITTPGQVKFYVRRRVGGIRREDRAVKLIKAAAT